MPIYVFKCTLGHRHEALCKHDLSDAPTECPKVLKGATLLNPDPVTCGLLVHRGVTAPSSLMPGADSWRK